MGVKEPKALVTADHAGAPGDPELYAAALRVLIGNWRGHATVPSRGLYPHQWSWDSAFVVLGLQHWAPGRAAAELLSLFGGQWADGRVPHIVFNPAVADEAYFPGPSFWWSALQPGSPPVATSGIIQPPVHAVAAAGLVDRLGARGLGFARRIYPHLVAQSSYLRQRRTVAPSGMAVVRHPWESGMDNSPAWDTPLARVPAELVLLDRYTRRDQQHAGNGERPTDADYARYIRLALAYRDSGYDDGWARGQSEFLVIDPAFNALWAWSELALAQIANHLEHDAEPHLAEASRITLALQDHLYQDDTKLFHTADQRTSAKLSERTVAGLVPLLLPDLRPEVVSGLVETLAKTRVRGHQRRSPRRRQLRPDRPTLRPPPLLARTPLAQHHLVSGQRSAPPRLRLRGRQVGARHVGVGSRTRLPGVLQPRDRRRARNGQLQLVSGNHPSPARFLRLLKSRH